MWSCTFSLAVVVLSISWVLLVIAATHWGYLVMLPAVLVYIILI